jgi:hypothetical protein
MFLVVWTDDGFDQMNDIIRNHPSRKHEFAVALRQITHQLTTDPLNVGESRTDDSRVMFAGEVSVFYRVDTDDNTVEVGSIRLRQP